MGISPIVSPPLVQVKWRRTPNKVTQIGGLLDIDAEDAALRNPVVTPVNDRFQDWPQAAIAISQPGKCFGTGFVRLIRFRK